jgi:hypothetical protein
MKLKITLALSLLLLAAAAAPAAVSFQPPLLFAGDASGTAVADGTYVLFIDTAGDELAGAPYLSTPLDPGPYGDPWEWDDDDHILDVGAVVAGQAAPNVSNILISSIPGYSVGVDHCWLAVFDLPYNAANDYPGGPVDYGMIDLGVVPGDGGTLSTPAFLTNMTLETLPIPEPASLVLLGLGGLMLLNRRRSA